MQLDGESEFFRAISGKKVHCNTAGYVADNANNGPIYCNLYTGLSNQFTTAVGYWANVASCNDCALNVELQWGVSNMKASSITSTFSASLTNSIMNSFTFGGFTHSDTVSVAVSTSVAHEMSSSVTRTLGSSCSASCGDDVGTGVVMWQWQMEHGQLLELGDVHPFTIYSCHFLCKDGYDANKEPKCPLGECRDTDCTICKSHVDAYASVV
jgi:hypothetical protein